MMRLGTGSGAFVQQVPSVNEPEEAELRFRELSPEQNR